VITWSPPIAEILLSKVGVFHLKHQPVYFDRARSIGTPAFSARDGAAQRRI